LTARFFRVKFPIQKGGRRSLKLNPEEAGFPKPDPLRGTVQGKQERRKMKKVKREHVSSYSWVERLKLILVWSAISIAVVFIFWAVYYAIHRNFGPVKEVNITEWWVVALPFPIPGLILDLAAPIWPTIFVLVFTSPRVRTNVDWIASVLMTMVVGMCVGRYVGFSGPFVAGLIFGLISSVGGLVWQLGVAKALGLGLGAGIVTSLPFGVFVAAAVLPGLFIGYHSGRGFRWLVKNFLLWNLWKKINATKVWRVAAPWLIGRKIPSETPQPKKEAPLWF